MAANNICYFLLPFEVLTVKWSNMYLIQSRRWGLVCSCDDCETDIYCSSIPSISEEDISLGCSFSFWLRSSLWLQYKPQHIAAGAVYLAAKMLNMDSDSCQNIWREF